MCSWTDPAQFGAPRLCFQRLFEDPEIYDDTIAMYQLIAHQNPTPVQF
jgi:hypothetical protein